MKNSTTYLIIMSWFLVVVVFVVVAVLNEPKVFVVYNDENLEEIDTDVFKKDDVLITVTRDFELEIVTIDVTNEDVLISIDFNTDTFTITKNQLTNSYNFDDIASLNVDSRDLSYAKLIYSWFGYDSHMDEFPEVLVYGFLGFIVFILGSGMILILKSLRDRLY